MTDALIKELREAEQQQPDMNTVHNLLRRARQALSAPGDAEREELANKLEAAVRTEYANSKADAESMGTITWSADVEQDYRLRIVQLLRRPDPVVTEATADVLAERRRQIEKEGWTPEHDDEHSEGQMASAAACYALASYLGNDWSPAEHWPWDAEWWKPSDRRRNLVKAAALILAEIERLDRAKGK